MRRWIVKLALLFYIACIVIGCQKKNQNMDYNKYIPDSRGVLIINKESDNQDYIEAIKDIDGDKKKLQNAVNTLEKMDSNFNVDNALGVAYLRLRDLDKANKYLTSALGWGDERENKSCVLNNIGVLKARTEGVAKGIPDFELALEEKGQSNLQNIAIQSNYLSAKIETEDSYIKEINELKRIIKREKNLQNENQVIGMCAYRTLAVGCCYSGKYMECETYLTMAQSINEKLYQNIFFESTIYERKATMYLNQDKLSEALDSINKAIELYESCQAKDYLDTIVAYQLRGSIYFYMGDYEQAVRDNGIVEERGCSDINVYGISYANSGSAYKMEGKNERAVDSYAKAYSIWKDSNQEGLKSSIESAMEELYHECGETEYGFEAWFDRKVEKAEEDLDERGITR